MRESQIAGIHRTKAGRDADAVTRALNNLRTAAAAKDDNTGNSNLLHLCVEAARARATLGEISSALEDVFGRHIATTQVVQGAYKASYNSNHSANNETNDFDEVLKAVKAFHAQEGRRPRMLVAKMGQDGHDRGAKVIASGFSDLGYDVDVGPLFSTPEEVAQQAVDNDVHVVGVSSQAAGHKTLVPALIAALKEKNGSHIQVSPMASLFSTCPTFLLLLIQRNDTSLMFSLLKTIQSIQLFLHSSLLLISVVQITLGHLRWRYPPSGLRRSEASGRCRRLRTRYSHHYRCHGSAHGNPAAEEVNRHRNRHRIMHGRRRTSEAVGMIGRYRQRNQLSKSEYVTLGSN